MLPSTELTGFNRQLRVKRCIEGCAEMDAYNGFGYHQGFMHKREEGKQGLVISVTGGAKGLKPGSAAVLDACGKVEERAGDACKDKPFSLFELYPMFRLEVITPCQTTTH